MADCVYELYEACYSDRDTLVDIFARAQVSDRVTQVKARDRPADYIDSLICDPLESWLRNERRVVLKAIATTTDEVVGWICLGFHDMPVRLLNPLPIISEQPEPVSSDRAVSNNTLFPVTINAGVDGNKRTRLDNETPPKKQESVHDLETLCSEDFQRWITKLMHDGRACMFIGSICILPEHQGRGIGQALLACATRVADDEQVSVWVHASEAGCRLFARAGFQEVGRLEIDLQRYRPLRDGIMSEDDVSEEGIYVY